jgi:hypothetical protein
VTRFDDIAECPRCLAWSHDEVEGTDDGGTLLLACCFCGYLVRINSAVKRRLEKGKPAEPEADAAIHYEDFRLAFGRCAGMTLAEVLAQPNGKEYLVWLRNNNQKLRRRIDAFFHTQGDKANV